MDVILSNLKLFYRNELILRNIDYFLNQLIPVVTDNSVEKQIRTEKNLQKNKAYIDLKMPFYVSKRVQVK